jgi:hypothetical protein
MRLSAMGDVAMRFLCFVNQYPEVKITVISRPFFKPFEGIAGVSFFDEKNDTKGL